MLAKLHFTTNYKNPLQKKNFVLFEDGYGIYTKFNAT